jgi:ferric-dicitrate binding protein FerR (iron transport regulator)
MDEQHIQYLIRQYQNGLITGEEWDELSLLLITDEHKTIIQEALRKEMEEHTPAAAFQNKDYSPLLKKITRIDQKEEKTPQYKAPLLRMPGKKWWAAAAVIIIFASAAIFLLNRKDNNIPATNDNKLLANDMAPGGNKAVLTLANGSRITLDSAANGELAVQGKSKVVKLANGRLLYSVSNGDTATTMYNTMSTPRGGQYQLQLPDGTQVWLNAASSITYPTAFTGNERKVTITGEAYFEVVHNPGKPFHVQVNEMDVRVLGTHFNINAYRDESSINTTLLEGSVKISTKYEVVIRPGQQARVSRGGQTIDVVDHTDTDQAVAWKNGLFNFYQSDLQAVMRQLSRWYDVEIKYEGNIQPRRFWGKIQRDLNLSEVLEILKETQVHFKLEGKTIIVMP